MIAAALLVWTLSTAMLGRGSALQRPAMHTDASSSTTPLLFKFFSLVLDGNGDGLISSMEVAHFISDTFDGAIPPEAIADADAILSSMDALDGDGLVSWPEFQLNYGRLADGDGRTAATSTTPAGIHLSCTEQSSDAYVIWETEDPTPGPDYAQYGLASGSYDFRTAPADQFTYESGQNGFYYEGWLHEAYFASLTPSTTYYYRVGSDASGWSEEFSFVTPPDKNNTAAWPYPFRYLTFGDMGTFMPFGRNVSQAITEAHTRDRYDMTVHLGDIAYAGTGSDREWNVVWEIFCRQIQPWAASSFYMTTVGNHEKYYDYAAYRHRFRMPQGGHPDADGRYDGFYYSFDYGPIHWTNVPSDDYPPNYPNPRLPTSDVTTWMRDDLARANANRDKVPFIIVTAHRPMYSTSSVGGWDDQRQGWEPLFAEFGVDMFLAGHIHCYERSYPLYNHTTTGYAPNDIYTDPTMPIHVTIGTAGAWVGADRWEEPDDWLASREFSYGFAHILAPNRTTLHFQYFSYSDIRNGGSETLYDEFWLVKN